MSYYSVLLIMNQGDDFNNYLEDLKKKTGAISIKLGGIFTGMLPVISGENKTFCLRKDLNTLVPNVKVIKNILYKHWLREKALDSGRYSYLSNNFSHVNLYEGTASTMSFDKIYNVSKNNKLRKGLTDVYLYGNRKRTKALNLIEWKDSFRDDLYIKMDDEDVLMVLEVHESDTDISQMSYDNDNLFKKKAKYEKELLSNSGNYARERQKKLNESNKKNMEKAKNKNFV